jgi:hypothetical protein
MRQRGITERQVLTALRGPDGNLPADPGRKRIFRNLNNRVAVVVVYQERTDRIAVITTYRRQRKTGSKR